MIIQYEDETSFVRQLRDKGLHAAATAIDDAIADLCTFKSGAKMAAVNMAWSRANRLLQGDKKVA